MKMYLYQINDGDNVLNKTLGNSTEINIMLKSETDIINPVILLETVSGFSYSDFNYCHIPELERYYFITSVQNVNNRLWRLNCECDVLMTYKSEILASKARLNRSIKNGDYFNASIDTSVIKTVHHIESNKSISNNKTLILSTVGE